MKQAQQGKRPRSALSQGADAPPESIDDWRRRGRMLLDRLLAMAAQDDALARSVVDGVARFAAASPGLRKRLSEEMRAAGAGRRRGARATPYWRHVQLLDFYELGIENGRSPEYMRQLLGRDLGISPRTVDNRLSRARRLVDPSHRLIHALRKTS